jgi:hypothetical protein
LATAVEDLAANRHHGSRDSRNYQIVTIQMLQANAEEWPNRL